MLTPEYLQGVPDPLVELYAQAEADILADMARRINGFDMFIPSAQYQMQKLEEMGVLRSEIISKLGKLTGKSERELAEIMRAAGLEALSSDEKIYKIAGVATAEHGKLSPAALKVLQAGFEKTNGLFTNLTKTTANTATKQFERALDRAYMQVSSGAFTSGEAVKNAVKSLAEQGIEAITYPSGHKDTIETAVRRAVITGVNQTCLKMQEARADELGCDLVETTAHPGARPTHAEWQGQIFSRSGKSRKYPDFVQVTGYGTGEGLGGWNCSHSFSPYFEGIPRTYTPEMLESYQAKDYEYNGEKMTLYEAQQKQREIERNLRRWKRENLAMKAAGQDTTQSAVKISEWQERQKDFLSQTGLKRQLRREQVAGWGRSEAAAARAQAKEKAIIDMLSSYGVKYIQRISVKEIIVDAGRPTIKGERIHALQNREVKADRVEMTIEKAQEFVDGALLTVFRPKDSSLKFLSLDGYAALNFDHELITAVPQKWRKKYDQYL